MTRQQLIDLYCGQGGAGHGYRLAGFRVVGVDIKPQPRYPYTFIQADAIQFLDALTPPELENIALIHASPPCQRYSVACMGLRRDYPDLLPPTREVLERTGRPYVIENVPGAPMRPDIILCGCMIGQSRLQRERWFETNWSGHVPRQPCGAHERIVSLLGGSNSRKANNGRAHRLGLRREIMRCWWMTAAGLSQAIPPSFTEHIGRMFLRGDAARRGACGPG